MFNQTQVQKRTSLSLFFLLFSIFAQAQITSNFSVNNESWTYFDPSTGGTFSPAYSATNGNPGGDISVTASTALAGYYWITPSKFLGNLSSSYNHNLTFDIKVSALGTDNSVADVILVGGGLTLTYQLPAKPTAGVWTSYSVPLIETQWNNGCPTCAVVNQVQMKQALASVTQLKIRLKYATSVFAPYVSQIDNVVLNKLSLGAPPIITSFAPTSALAGTSVTITGLNFNSTASQNIVYFAGMKATVTSASTTQLVVKVPNSACVGKITVINATSGLEGSSNLNFNPLFDNNSDFGSRIIPSTFKPGYFTQLSLGNNSNGSGNTDKGDFNNDGWVDLVATETSSKSIFVYQNLGSGVVNASSFGTPLQLNTGLSYLSELQVADFDNDGKLDIAASVEGTFVGVNAGYFAVFRNTTVGSTISFASPLYFQQPYNSTVITAQADLDGDGLVDLIGGTGSSGSYIWVCQNQSTPGNIDFAYGIALGTSSSYLSIAPGDLDGDGKIDLALYGYFSTNIYIYQNSSAGGTISFNVPFTVTASSGSGNGGIYATDLDADGKLDLAYANYNNGNLFIRKNNYSSGVFDATAFGAELVFTSQLSHPTGIRSCDVNGDGKSDVVIGGSSDLAVFQNVGTGSLSSSSFLAGIMFQCSVTGSLDYFTTPTIADFDGDNKAEIILEYTNSASPSNEKGIYIFHNESFQPPQITAVNPSSATSGSTVTVTGNYLYTKNTTPQMSGVGIITAASNVSNTSLQISTPTGFSDNRISATLHGLQTFSPTQFYTQLNNGAGGAVNSSTFGASVDFNLSSFAANPGLAVADYDQDGKPDVVIDDNGTAKIYANTISSAGATITSGSFTISASTLNSAAHLRATDLDGNGIQDIVTTGSVFAGQGLSPNPISFSASAFTSVNNANQILVNHDFNLDGKPEIAISNTSGQIQVFENFTNTGAPFVYSGGLGSLSTTPLTYANAGTVVGLTAADFDGDGFEDIAYALYGTISGMNILLNAGQRQIMTSSQFTGPTNFPSLLTPQYITTADFNGDGKMDIAIGYSSTSAFISVYQNTSTVGSLSFTRQDFASPAFCNGIEVGDIDGDGKPEIVTINNPSGTNGSFSIYRNISSSGLISFSTAVTFSLSTTVPKILALADVNLDNKTDIIISRTGATSATLSIFQNFISFPTLSISQQPTSSYSVCNGAAPTLSVAASGTTNVAYQWQVLNPSSGVYNDLTNTGGYSSVSTSSMTINSAGNFGAGTYRCKITGDFAAPVYSNTVSFTVNIIPSAPTAADVNFCPPNTATLTASGGSNGQYLWYDQSGLIISGQTNATYTTQSISSTTSYLVAITNGSCTSAQTSVKAVAQSVPSAPTANNVNFCAPNTATLLATGGSSGQYLWYDQNGLISGQNNSSYTTPSISSTTSYSVAINNGFCISAKTNVNAVAQSIPSSPTASDVSFCPPNTVALSASGGSNGQYLWYDQSGLISGQTNGTYTTPSISVTTSYSVAVSNGFCTSAKTNVRAVVSTSGCSAPVITSEPLSTQVGGKITVDLKPLISTPNSTLDLTSLQIVLPPSSGATATIDNNGILTITYTSVSFSGTENITIKACDVSHNCTQQQFGIEVVGDIEIFNGVSPNGANPKFIIQYIELLPETKDNKVYIFDRWENMVWHGTNYDNTSVVFTGNNDSGNVLPSGVYFYKIEFVGGRSTKTGFISLRR
jgi:hypothetical protein